MMALATVHLQGPCSSFPNVPSRGSQLNHFLPLVAVPRVGRRDSLVSLKCRSYSSGRASFLRIQKSELFTILAFKGGNRHDGSGSKANGSKSLKNPIKVSYLQHENDESFMESSEAQNVVPAPYTAEDERATRALAIQNLFKNWLMLLHSPQSQGSPPVEGALPDPSEETSELPNTMQKIEKRAVFKAAWCYFWGLDSTAKIPLLIFGPLYLAVNLAYGSEVSKELTPLWILGPLVVALYVKMLRGICSLYVFSFKQTVKVVKSLPTCYMLAHEYLFRGKLKEAIHKYLWKPLVDIKEMDYKELAMRKLKDFQGWLWEKYLDYVESIWPTYCRTLRFLKRANLI